MKQIFRISILLFAIMLSFSCQNEKTFDSNKWKQSGGESLMLDTRKEMVSDLLKRKILLHKSHNEIVELIGSPVNYNNTVFEFKEYYPVQEKHGSDIDPIITYVEITFDRNGISEAVQIVE
ncbi:MAG: hypothetical protein PHQ74_03780 [Crocinitomicaceae bacterium]|nr:hypothetical protein [Crocinitomicaceae bacterium]